MESKDEISMKEILLQNWSHIQDQIARSSSLRWKIRGALAAVWWASLLFDVEKNKPVVFVLVVMVVFLGFLYEIELKEQEEKVIYKSRDIEKKLSMIAIGDYDYVIKQGLDIGTSIDRKSLKYTFKAIFTKERWKFWFPYVFTILFTIIYASFRMNNI